MIIIVFVKLKMKKYRPKAIFYHGLKEITAEEAVESR